MIYYSVSYNMVSHKKRYHVERNQGNDAKIKLWTKARPPKMWARVGENQLGVRTEKYKLETRTEAEAGDQGWDQVPVSTDTLAY